MKFCAALVFLFSLSAYNFISPFREKETEKIANGILDDIAAGKCKETFLKHSINQDKCETFERTPLMKPLQLETYKKDGEKVSLRIIESNPGAYGAVDFGFRFDFEKIESGWVLKDFNSIR